MNKLRIGFLIVVTLFLLVAVGYYYVSQQSYTNYISHQTTTSLTYVTISAAESKQLIETQPKEEIVILDVRTVEEYHEGHIEGAILIPLQKLQKNYAMSDKDRIIIIYCRTGVRSAQASQILVDNGFTKVYNMDGGITAWINEEFPIVIPNGCGC